MDEPTRTRPFAPFEWMLSLRYLRARRQEGFISVNAGFSFLGIMLGVATLIIVMAVMNGFRKELLDKILGLNGHLLIQPLEQPLTDWEAVTERISKVPGVTLAAPIVEGQALASSPFNASGVLVRGVRAADLARLPSVATNIRQGTLEGFDEGQGVAIGRRLADQLSLRAGDSVTLVAPRGAVTPMGTTPRIKPYRIAAVFEVGMSEYDTAFVFMPLPEAQAYFNRAGDVTAIEVYVDNPDQIDTHRKLITEAAGRPIFLIDWRQRNATFFNALQVERNVMFLILTIIVIVAAFNITSGLIMLVKDKGRDIGILRTMGVTQGAIMRVFMMTGASVGVVGTVVGFLLALLVCLNIESIRRFLSWLTNTELFSPELYFLSKLPADLDAGETTAVVVMALSLSLLATLYPAWRAARLDPVEARRPPRRIERREQRQRERHDHHRGGFAGIEIGGQLGEEIELGRKQLGVGQPGEKAADRFNVEAHQERQQEPDERADHTHRRAGHHEHAHDRALRRAHGAQNADVVALVLHQHDQPRRDVERGDDDDDGEDQKHHVALDLQRIKERGVALAPVDQEDGARGGFG